MIERKTIVIRHQTTKIKLYQTSYEVFFLFSSQTHHAISDEQAKREAEERAEAEEQAKKDAVTM